MGSSRLEQTIAARRRELRQAVGAELRRVREDEGLSIRDVSRAAVDALTGSTTTWPGPATVWADMRGAGTRILEGPPRLRGRTASHISEGST